MKHFFINITLTAPTPIFPGELLRFESVRGNYGSEPHCPTCGLQRRDPAMGTNSCESLKSRSVASQSPPAVLPAVHPSLAPPGGRSLVLGVGDRPVSPVSHVSIFYLR